MLSLAASVLNFSGRDPPKHDPVGRSVSEFKVTALFGDKELLSLYFFLGETMVLWLC
jgi:hypothetical protein